MILCQNILRCKNFDYREYVVKETNKYKNKYDEKYIESHIDELFKFVEELLDAGKGFGFKIIRR